MGSTDALLLIVAALAPAVALCVYVFKKDRVEKEPAGLLTLLLFMGVVVIVPVLIFSEPFTAIHSAIFGNMPSGPVVGRISIAWDAFINVALLEEGFKWLALILITRNNKNFNSLFDGMIYAVFVSLGFAGAENVMYCLMNGWATAVMRAVLSVPGHMFFAVLMGYYYSFWHMYDKANKFEKSLKTLGKIPSDAVEFDSKRFVVLSLVMPVLAHGLYDYCCFVNTTVSTLVLYAFVIFLYIHCFKKIKAMSKSDTGDVLFVKYLLIKKYPQLKEYFFPLESSNVLESTETPLLK